MSKPTLEYLNTVRGKVDKVGVALAELFDTAIDDMNAFTSVLSLLKDKPFSASLSHEVKRWAKFASDLKTIDISEFIEPIILTIALGNTTVILQQLTEEEYIALYKFYTKDQTKNTESDGITVEPWYMEDQPKDTELDGITVETWYDYTKFKPKVFNTWHELVDFAFTHPSVSGCFLVEKASKFYIFFG